MRVISGRGGYRRNPTAGSTAGGNTADDDACGECIGAARSRARQARGCSAINAGHVLEHGAQLVSTLDLKVLSLDRCHGSGRLLNIFAASLGSHYDLFQPARILALFRRCSFLRSLSVTVRIAGKTRHLRLLRETRKPGNASLIEALSYPSSGANPLLFNFKCQPNSITIGLVVRRITGLSHYEKQSYFITV